MRTLAMAMSGTRRRSSRWKGYTSFLWVALLDVVWRLTGIEPPAAANPIALVFAAGTLLLVAGMVLQAASCRRRWNATGWSFLALVLLGTLTNRTFLAWTSSGLETAMFNFWLTAWAFVAFSLRPASARVAGPADGAAVLMELTRPDGLLFLAATLFLAAVSLWQRLRARRLPALASACPQPSTPHRRPPGLARGHLSRLAARTLTRPSMPGRGPRAASATCCRSSSSIRCWFWLAVAGCFWSRCCGAARAPRALVASGRRRSSHRWCIPSPPARCWRTSLYYTFIIGGDHFEYRVYSQLVPLLLVSFVWLLNALAVRPAVALGLIGLSLAAGLPIPWTHWALTQRYHTRAETFNLQRAGGARLPRPGAAIPGMVRQHAGLADPARRVRAPPGAQILLRGADLHHAAARGRVCC